MPMTLVTYATIINLLDSLSRCRALTSDESLMLETAIRKQYPCDYNSRERAWTRSEEMDLLRRASQIGWNMAAAQIFADETGRSKYSVLSKAKRLATGKAARDKMMKSAEQQFNMIVSL
jgi:hypothetical protein